MKSYLETRQELYELIQSQTRQTFFLRNSQNGKGLWISDVQRRNPDLSLDFLSAEGYCYQSAEGLTELRLRPDRLVMDSCRLPMILPAFPQNEWQLEPYRLCRLLLFHSWNGLPCDTELCSRIFWLTGQNPQRIPQYCRQLIRDSAALLREHRLSCVPGGQLLAFWLQKGENQ